MQSTSLNDSLNRAISQFAYNTARLPPFTLTGGLASTLVNSSDAGNTASTTVRLTDYGKLRSALSSFNDGLAAVGKSANTNNVIATSSNPKMRATISGSGTPPAKVSVEVFQLAQSQQIQSRAFSDSEATNLGNGSISIETGRFDSTANTFVPNSQPAATLTISLFNRSLDGIANTINQASAGISAKVSRANGENRLVLTGAATGANQAFRIQINDADGNNNDIASGLSRLAFDPAQLLNAGQNQMAVQSAQDARVAVDGKPLASDTNQLPNAISGATIDFSATGEATLQFERNTSNPVTAAKGLVGAINQYQTQRSDLAIDGIAMRVVNQIDAAINNARTNVDPTGGSFSSLGITVDKAGMLSLDEAKLNKAITLNASGVAKLLDKTAQQLGDTVSNTLNVTLRNGSLIASLAAPSSADLPSNGNTATDASSATGFQSLFARRAQPTSYLPTTRSLYGLGQYLRVASY